jgi:hypothetical protein
MPLEDEDKCGQNFPPKLFLLPISLNATIIILGKTTP